MFLSSAPGRGAGGGQRLSHLLRVGISREALPATHPRAGPQTRQSKQKWPDVSFSHAAQRTPSSRSSWGMSGREPSAGGFPKRPGNLRGRFPRVWWKGQTLEATTVARGHGLSGAGGSWDSARGMAAWGRRWGCMCVCVPDRLTAGVLDRHSGRLSGGPRGRWGSASPEGLLLSSWWSVDPPGQCCAGAGTTVLSTTPTAQPALSTITRPRRF